MRREREARVRVHQPHLRALPQPVVGVVLHDAQRVDPEVAQLDAAAEGDGVADGLRERVVRNGGAVGGEVGVSRTEHVRGVGAPDVAEAGVRDWVGWGGEEGVAGLFAVAVFIVAVAVVVVVVVGEPDVYEAVRLEFRPGSRAVRVVGEAVGQPGGRAREGLLRQRVAGDLQAGHERLP